MKYLIILILALLVSCVSIKNDINMTMLVDFKMQIKNDTSGFNFAKTILNSRYNPIFYNDEDNKKAQKIISEKINSKYPIHKYSKKLLNIFLNDQKIRLERDVYRYLNDSIGLNKSRKQMKLIDSINLAACSKYFRLLKDTNNISKNFNKFDVLALFFVIQHNGADKIIEYIPVFEYCTKVNLFEFSALTLMIDRSLSFKNKPQIYGTQYILQSNGKIPFKHIPIDSMNIARLKHNLDSINVYWQKIGGFDKNYLDSVFKKKL